MLRFDLPFGGLQRINPSPVTGRFEIFSSEQPLEGFFEPLWPGFRPVISPLSVKTAQIRGYRFYRFFKMLKAPTRSGVKDKPRCGTLKQTTNEASSIMRLPVNGTGLRSFRVTLLFLLIHALIGFQCSVQLSHPSRGRQLPRNRSVTIIPSIQGILGGVFWRFCPSSG